MFVAPGNAPRLGYRELREARHGKHREEVHAKVEELKSKLHLDRKPATTSS
jgi:hypothetical protein